MHLGCWLVLFTYLFFLVSFIQKHLTIPLFGPDKVIEFNSMSNEDNWLALMIELVERPKCAGARRSQGIGVIYKDDRAIERKMIENELDTVVDKFGTWVGYMAKVGNHRFYVTAEQRRMRAMADRLDYSEENESIEEAQQEAQPVAMAVAA